LAPAHAAGPFLSGGGPKIQPMSRPLRLDHAGAIWHVTARGNDRRKIYRDDRDRQRWLDLLGRTAESFNWRVHAYTQMGNHYHLVVETLEATLSTGMRQLNGVYAQGFNRRHHRTGHLFQGRFHAVLVDREEYLLELTRYVVQNPVRAGIVASPREWRWSSHRAMAGLAAAPAWLETAWTLQHFGGCRKRYAEFVNQPSDLQPREVHGRGIALGKERFRREYGGMAAVLDLDAEIPLAHRRPEPLRVDDLLPRLFTRIDVKRDELGVPRRRCHERGLVAYALRRFCRAPAIVIGRLTGVSRWQASRLARQGGDSWPRVGFAGLLI
jgi:putative transposase